MKKSSKILMTFAGAGALTLVLAVTPTLAQRWYDGPSYDRYGNPTQYGYERHNEQRGRGFGISPGVPDYGYRHRYRHVGPPCDPPYAMGSNGLWVYRLDC
jgi:hypothetical protein